MLWGLPWREWMPSICEAREEFKLPKETSKLVMKNALLWKVYEYIEQSTTNIAKQSDNDLYLEKCRRLNDEWIDRMTERLLAIYGVTADEALVSFSKSKFILDPEAVSISDEEAISFLKGLLATCLLDGGLDARMSVVLGKLRRFLSLSLQKYMDEVEGKVVAQVVSGETPLAMAKYTLADYTAGGDSLLSSPDKAIEAADDIMQTRSVDSDYDRLDSPSNSITSNASLSSQSTNLNAQHSTNVTTRRSLLVGVGALIGGLALGVTAGMAAPVLVPFIAGLAGATASSSLILGVTSAAGVLFGAGGAGFTAYRVHSRYRDVKEFEFVPLALQNRLSVMVGVSGWLRSMNDVYDPWRLGSRIRSSDTASTSDAPNASEIGSNSQLDDSNISNITSKMEGVHLENVAMESDNASMVSSSSFASATDHALLTSRDRFALKYETEAFQELGTAIADFVATSAVTSATVGILKTTALATAVSAVFYPMAVIQAGLLIDNPWSVCINIAHRAGLILADAIRTRAHGHRPVCFLL